MSDIAAMYGGRFGPNMRHYVLTLSSLTPILMLQRTELISAIHKLHRRDMGNELAALCLAFFEAVSAALSATPQLKAAATNFVNRIGIAVLEEGTFVHLPRGRQEEVVARLRAAHLARERSDWSACCNNVLEVVRLTSGVPRGRLGSVAARHVLDGRPVPPEAEGAARALDAKAIGLASKARDVAFAAAAQGLPSLLPLLQPDCKFSSCAEFRRQAYQCAAVAGFVDPVDVAPPAQLLPRAPTREQLDEIGTRDCHVLGKANASAWRVFLERGCRITNPTRARIFGHDYAFLEANYIRGKLADVESGAAAASAKASRKQARKPSAAARNVTPTAGPATSYLATEPDVTAMPATAMPEAPREFDLVAPGPGDGLLGFKNATCCGRMLRNLHPFFLDDRVFLKLGEEPLDFAFGKKAYEDMHALGMPSVAAAVLPARFSLDAWASFGAATDKSERQKWTAAMVRKMGKHDGAVIPAMLCEEIVGRRLQDVPEGDPILSSPAYGESLMRAALYSKRVAAKDFQPYNLMIRRDGNVIQVDINRANPLQIKSYNEKGLQTSRSFGARFWNPVRRYAREHPVALARFLSELIEMVPLAEGVRTRLFTQEAQALLLEGRGDAFLQLA